MKKEQIIFNFGYKSEFLQAQEVFNEFSISYEILGNDMAIKINRKNLPTNRKLNKFWQKMDNISALVSFA